MLRALKTLSGLLVLGFVAFIVWLYFFNPGDKEDPLCALAKNDFQMNCSILAAPGVYEKGAVVNLPTPPEGQIQRVGFPAQQIFGSACIVGPPLADFATFKEQPGQSVVFGKRELTIDRSVSAGAKLNIPEAANFDLQGGPNISDVRSILLSADSAQVFTIDQTAAQDAINACSIRASCTNGVSPTQGIVTRLLIAKNLQYSVKDKNGAVFPLEAAAEKGLVKLGLRGGREVISTQDLSSGKDMVFAVETARPSQFNLKACQSSLKILKVDGYSKARAVTKDNIIDEKTSPGDREVGAHVRYLLPDMERINDSIDMAEAFASGKWSRADNGAALTLDSNVFSTAGSRWPIENPAFKKTYASSSAMTELALDIGLVSRESTAKTLVLILAIDFKSNRKFVPPYQMFDELVITSSAGAPRNVPAIWNAGDVQKEFSLGRIDPGDVTTVKLVRRLSFESSREYDAGRTDERLLVSFELR